MKPTPAPHIQAPLFCRFVVVDLPAMHTGCESVNWCPDQGWDEN